MSDQSTLETKLLSALNQVETSGRVSGAIQSDLTVVELVVHDVGKIEMPLAESQARRIAAKAHQAPYGRGTETLVDLSVRNTWELSPDEFLISNESVWESYLDRILPTVAQQLGIQVPIHAELYKMLLYEEGAMFKAHTDTEKIPGMFGTLVFVLPSAHKGGNVVLKHRKTIDVHSTSEMEKGGAVFWYSDVSHEVLPVTEGFRWVLTYNLAIKEGVDDKPSATSLMSESQELHNIMSEWKATVDQDHFGAMPLYYMLDHEYTEANISLAHLKNRDRAVIDHLTGVSEELGFDLLLATVEKETKGSGEDDYYERGYGRYGHGYGYDDEEEDEEEDDDPNEGTHTMDEVYETTYSLKMLFDLEGRKIVEGIPMDEQAILQDLDEAFDGEPDDEEHEGYMGNWGPEVTHWYRRSTLVIIPSQGTYGFLSRSLLGSNETPRPTSIMDIATWYAKICLSSSVSSSAIKAIHRICESLLPSTTTNTWGGTTHVPQQLKGTLLADMLKISLLHKQNDLFDCIVKHNKEPIPVDFFPWVVTHIDQQATSWEKMGNMLGSSIQAQPSIHLQFAVISELSTSNREIPEELQQVLASAANQALETAQTMELILFEEDGVAVFELVLKYKPFEYVKTKLLPPFETRSFTAFKLGFLNSLDSAIRDEQVPRADAIAVYENLASSTIGTMNIAAVTSHVEEPPKSSSLTEPTEPKRSHNFVKHEAVTTFIDSLLKFDLKRPLEQLAAEFSRRSSIMPVREFNTLYIPVLQGLLGSLKAYDISPQIHHFQDAFQAVLGAYINNYVGKEPRKGNYARTPVKCVCEYCLELNRFLRNTGAKNYSFRMAERHRKHLEYELGRTGTDCACSTIRNGSPHTLVVTKTSRDYEKRHAAWVERRLAAKHNISAFDQRTLRILLADKYNDITSLRCSPTLTSGSSSATANPAAASPTVLSPSVVAAQQPPAPAPAPAPRSATPLPWGTTPAPVAGLAHSHRSPLAPTSGNIDDELVRLQVEIARAGGIEPPSPLAPPPPLPPSSRPQGKPKAADQQRLTGRSTPGATPFASSTSSSPLTASRLPQQPPPPPPRSASITAIATANLASNKSRPSSSQLPPVRPLARTKRKAAEMVDLTGDSD